MEITHTDKETLEREITVKIEPSDYKSKVKAELKKLSTQANVKGFRKGRSLNYLRKTHGQSVVSKVVYEILEENLNDYIHAHEMNIIGQPMVSEAQDSFKFNINENRDYVFVFDVGMAPDVELSGYDKESSYERYDVQIGDDIIDEELEGMRKQAGEQVEVDEDIEENDILILEGKELESGEVKEYGWETSFSVHVGSLSEGAQNELIGKDKGYDFQYNIYELGNDTKETFVKKHYLNIDEEEDIEVNEEFQLKVLEIKRLKPADLDEDFFNLALGGQVDNEEEARELIRKEIKKGFDKQADAILSHAMHDGLLESNQIKLPHEFLLKWLELKQQEDGQALREDEFQDFTKNMKWSLITAEIRHKYNLEVTEQEIIDRLKMVVIQQFQGYQLPDEYMDQLVRETAKDKEKVSEIADTIMSDKIIATFKDNVTIKDIPVSIDEFNDIIKEFNERLRTERGVDEEE